MRDVRAERTYLNMGTLTADVLREAGSFTVRPLAAWRSTVAMLWQSMRTVSVKNDSYKPVILAFNSATSQRGHGMAILVSHPEPGTIPESLSMI